MSSREQPTNASADYPSFLTAGFIRRAEKKYIIKHIPNEIHPIIYQYTFDNAQSEQNAVNDPNLTNLIYITTNTINEHCKHRFFNEMTKKAYSYVSSNILLSINPFERLPIYGQDVINEFHENKKLSQQIQAFKNRPHPYALASILYSKLSTTKSNQFAIIMGQSCSGKVCIIIYFVYVAIGI